jgi:hypothetical protein
MDLATLGLAASGLLAALFKRLGDKTIDSLAEEAAQSSGGAVIRLYEKLRAKFGTRPALETAVTRLQANPDNDVRRRYLAELLAELFEEDSDLRVLAAEILTGAAREHEGMTVINTGIVAQGSDVTLKGKYAAGRDVRVNVDGDHPNSTSKE